MEKLAIGIIGLGYVGLPLMLEFARECRAIIKGFDINVERVKELKAGLDKTDEIDEFLDNMEFTNHIEDLKDCNFYIVAVPTPIDNLNQPDLSPLIDASQAVASILSVGNVVVYESTVYPTCTEDVCVPILAKVSGLEYNKEFFVGYSPERVNPADKNKKIPDIIKVTSGSTPSVADLVDSVYRKIIKAGTYKASSIQVAEASKIVENIQRDVNIGIMNELSIVFRKLGIDTDEVLQAAGTKWNFIPMKPGLVGGHCISVDPYYLQAKANDVGVTTNIINATRFTNNQMPYHISSYMLKLLHGKDIDPTNAKILILGLSFKEDCPDTRNSLVFVLHDILKQITPNVHVYDPIVDKEEIFILKDINLIPYPRINYYDAVLLAVSHKKFKKMGISDIKGFMTPKSIFMDLKGMFAKGESDFRL